MAESRFSFFRQSGWLVIATTTSGAFMYAVHKVASQMPKEEYGVFTTLLQVINLMGIPAIALQTVFAQQAAAAVREQDRHQLASAMRSVFVGTFVVWLLMALAVTGLHRQLLAEWKIANPAALWITVAYGLGAVWMPVLMGVLQGRQNFLWFGNALIVNGIARFTSVAVIVLALGGHAAGGMGGALLGLTAALMISFWHDGF